jgi:hypothetical protein
MNIPVPALLVFVLLVLWPVLQVVCLLTVRKRVQELAYDFLFSASKREIFAHQFSSVFPKIQESRLRFDIVVLVAATAFGWLVLWSFAAPFIEMRH